MLFTTAWPVLLLKSLPSQKVYKITKCNFSKERNQLHFYTFHLFDQKRKTVLLDYLENLLRRGALYFI